MPNVENIRLWTEALRSGKYKQGRGALRREGNYCCLGVACDIYDPDGWRAGLSCYVHGGNSDSGYLPRAVAEWLGLTTNPKVEGMFLADVNDSGKYSLAQIADMIEKEYVNA